MAISKYYSMRIVCINKYFVTPVIEGYNCRQEKPKNPEINTILWINCFMLELEINEGLLSSWVKQDQIGESHVYGDSRWRCFRKNSLS